jgi:hypothetical protein
MAGEILILVGVGSYPLTAAEARWLVNRPRETYESGPASLCGYFSGW